MNKKIAIITYARFPSEMAYGNHLIQIANSFIDNGFDVSIYYPKTYNTKTHKKLTHNKTTQKQQKKRPPPRRLPFKAA